MATFILIVLGVLILGVAWMLFRVQTLVAIAKGDDERVGASNKVNAALFIIFPAIGFGLMAWYSPYAAQYFLPAPASVHGEQTDYLFWLNIVVIMAMFIITNVALFWFAYRYQYSPNRRAFFHYHNNTLEYTWSIVTGVILAALVLSGARVWYDTMMVEPPKDAEVVEVMGKQFGWQVRYPGKDKQLGNYNFRLIDDALGNEFGVDYEDSKSNDDFVGTKMVIPVNKSVLLKIRARDVLHSVFLPHFRVKMDAVPGMPTQFHFIPTKTTAQMRSETGNPNFNYEMACTEVCGRGHFAMRLIVEVVEEEDYKKWYAEQKPLLDDKPELKGRGLSIFNKKKLAANTEK